MSNDNVYGTDSGPRCNNHSPTIEGEELWSYVFDESRSLWKGKCHTCNGIKWISGIKVDQYRGESPETTIHHIKQAHKDQRSLKFESAWIRINDLRSKKEG